MKRAILALAVAASFLLGYAGMSAAWPGVPDRAANNGYFTNIYDNTGGSDVLRGGIYSQNAEQFINDVLSHMNPVVCCRQNLSGMEFIIHTMIGSPPDRRYRPLADWQIEDWKRRVRFAASQNRINFNGYFNTNINSRYMGEGDNDRSSPHDNTFYFASIPNDERILFYNENGQIAYALRKVCANPVGDVGGGIPPAPPDFRFDGESYIDGPDRGAPGAPYVTGRKNLLVYPGDIVNFFHFVWNWGPGGGWVRYHAWQHPRNTTPTPSPQWQTAPPMQGAPFRPNPGDIFLNPGQNELVNWSGFRIPANAQPETTYCQHIGFFWTAWDRPYPTDRLDRQACAEVAYAYNLIPTTTASRAVALPGDQVTFSYRVQNQGPTISRPVNWGTNIRTITPTTNPQQLPAEDKNTGQYRLPFDQASNNVRVAYTVGIHPMNNGTASGAMTKTLTVNGNPGDKICSSGAIEPVSSSGVQLRYSAESCVTIAKYPTAHFMGGDISVGNPYQNVQPDCSLRNNTGSIFTASQAPNVGSTVEYAAFVRGVIKFQQSAKYGFGTASQSGITANGVRKLSFANTNSNAFGRLGSGDCMTDHFAKFRNEIPPSGSPGSRNLSNLAGEQRFNYNGDLTINASTIRNGARIIVVVNGNVTINGNITYSGNYPSRADVPSIAIIAGDDGGSAKGNITINGNVTQLDGMLISKNTIHTCDDTTGPMSTSICNRQLTLNGLIQTDKLNLRRTFGAQAPDIDKPAERFNFTTELFFNNVLADNSSGIVDTVGERDLPPRY